KGLPRGAAPAHRLRGPERPAHGLPGAVRRLQAVRHRPRGRAGEFPCLHGNQDHTDGLMQPDASTDLSYVCPRERESPWGTFLTQVDRVRPYLGELERWVGTLTRPKR